jgi:hypothetical protein
MIEDIELAYGRALARVAARESAVMIGAARHRDRSSGLARRSAHYFQIRDVLTHTAATLAEISADSGAALNTVRTYLAEMIAEGIVTRTKVPNATGGFTNFYALKPGVRL